MIEASSAGFGRRFAALLYDALLLAGILLIITTAAVFAHHGAILPQTDGALAFAYRLTLLLVVVLYYTVNWTRSGSTLGMRAWRLRAVMDSGTPMRWPFALLRLPLSLLAWAPLAMGVLWLYADPERAAVQDRLSRTRVVRLP